MSKHILKVRPGAEILLTRNILDGCKIRDDSIRCAAHVLELKGKNIKYKFSSDDSLYIDDVEGWNSFASAESSAERYEFIRTKFYGEKITPPMFRNRHRLSRYPSSGEREQYVSSMIETDNHAISLSVVRDGEQVHVIMCDRGGVVYAQGSGVRGKIQCVKNAFNVIVAANPVKVYTFKANEFPAELFRSFNQQRHISETDINGLLDNLDKRSNGSDVPQGLRQSLNQSYQTVGNCTVSNSYIIWQIELASQYMKANFCDFTTAVKAVRTDYDRMRAYDKVLALDTIIRHAKYQDSLSDGNSLLRKSLAKFSDADISTCIKDLYAVNPESVLALASMQSKLPATWKASVKSFLHVNIAQQVQKVANLLPNGSPHAAAIHAAVNISVNSRVKNISALEDALLSAHADSSIVKKTKRLSSMSLYTTLDSTNIGVHIWKALRELSMLNSLEAITSMPRDKSELIYVLQAKVKECRNDGRTERADKLQEVVKQLQTDTRQITLTQEQANIIEQHTNWCLKLLRKIFTSLGLNLVRTDTAKRIEASCISTVLPQPGK